MPTTNTASANGVKRGPKPARKAALRKPDATKTSPPVATARPAARPHAHQGDQPARARADRAAGALGDYAERAVLIPVGAALIARERVVSGVSDTVSRYSSTSKAKAQLRRFERRGATARNRLEREVRKVRVRVERELRQRRREIERTVNGIEDRRDAVAKNGTELANRVPGPHPPARLASPASPAPDQREPGTPPGRWPGQSVGLISRRQ